MKKLLILCSLSILALLGCGQVDTNRSNAPTDNQKTAQQAPTVQDDYIVPQWGSRFYKAHNGKIEAIEHIWLRHNYNSTYDNVSRFAKSYSTRQGIKNLVADALKKASNNEIERESGGHKTVTTTMDKQTGFSQKGKPTYKIRIHLDNKNFVKSAYPY